MSTLSVRLPESVHRKLKQMAEKEGVSMNQLISLAVTEKLSSLLHRVDYTCYMFRRHQTISFVSVSSISLYWQHIINAMSKEELKSASKTSNFKKSLMQWFVIGVVLGTLYLTGLHNNVIIGMQRALLYTGLFNAQITDITTSDGPFLTDADYSFSMVTSDGKMETLRDFEGKVTFVNVWASWCPPCVAEMPSIETLYTTVSDNENIRFIMLSLDNEPNNATQFMEDREYTMPYHFPGTRLPQVFNSTVLPTTYVVSKEGQVVYKKRGFADYSSPAFAKWLIELSEQETLHE